jgi:hypothetical protein
VLSGGSRWLLYRGGGSSCTGRRRGTGGGTDGGVHRLPKEGEAEVAIKGGIRGGGMAGRLLAMARETGSGQGAEDGGSQPACPREEDEGRAGWLGRPKAEAQWQFGGGG